MNFDLTVRPGCPRIAVVRVATVALFALVSVIQADPADNGNWWLTQSTSFKQAYVLGSLERIGKLAFVTSAPPALHAVINHAEVGQVCEGLELFYRDFAYRSIHVQDAIDICLMRIGGASSEDISAAVAAARTR